MLAARTWIGDVVSAEMIKPTINVQEGDILDGRYRIERRLGGGGMGVVWAAHHIHLNTRVAIKFPHQEILQHPDSVQRFMREARAAANIKCDHVARVLDVAVLDSGIPFQVIEYLEGGDLRAWLKQKGPLKVTQAVDFMLQICEAIAQAHTMGIIHRDLKPENLFCTLGKDGLCIKVLDFGISKLLQESALNDGAVDTAMTRAGMFLGSPQYMSPEHLQSAREVDARTDIWSLGVILFELLTGRVPFHGATLPELSIKIATQPTPSLRSLQPEVCQELEAVIGRCLEKQREQRYEDVASFANSLRPFASGKTDRFQRPLPSPRHEDEFATLLPSSSLEQENLEKSSLTVGTWEKKASTRPAWRRNIPWSVAAVAAVSIAAFVGFRTQPARRHDLSSAAAPSESVPLTPVPNESNSGPRLVPKSEVVDQAKPLEPLHVTDAGVTEGTNISPVSSASAGRGVSRPINKGASGATRQRADCNPNYNLDVDGQRHYKPECF